MEEISMLRRGWLIDRDGKRHHVPEPLLDEEEITWPPTLSEKRPGERTKMLSASDFYRRHELVPDEVVLFLATERSLEDVPEQVIADLTRAR
jgi:hypothetical protein